jgi:glycosyltransferase involved in cell wall biosynthesis
VQPTPVNVERFDVRAKPASEKPRILYVGRLSKEKNVALLIRAVREMEDDFELTIVGDGKERAALERLAQGDGRIRFLGAVSHKKLPEFYARADIFALPSNTESFGKVLLEAGAARCAIVATSTAGATTILTHEKDALLVPVGSQSRLKKALSLLIHDKNFAATLAAEAYTTAHRYSYSESTRRTVDFWKKIAHAQ